jgi:mannosyltransferase
MPVHPDAVPAEIIPPKGYPGSLVGLLEDGEGAARSVPAPRLGKPRSRRPVDLARRVCLSVWFAPALATAGICLWRMAGLWSDELTSYDVARRSLTQVLGTIRHVDAVHGAYYVLLHLWISAFGTSLTVLRLPGVLSMVGAAVCVSLTAKRLFGRFEGLTAGLVFALIPAVARYATEVRSYALVTFVAALATQLLIRALERSTPGRWCGYAAALWTAALLNLIAVAIVAGHLLGVLAYSHATGTRRVISRYLIATAVAVTGTAPIVYLGHRQAQRQIGSLKAPTLSQLHDVWPQITCSTLGAGVLLLALVAAWQHPVRWGAAAISATAVLPVLTVWVLSQAGTSYFYFARYFMFVVPAWAVLAGVAARSLPGWRGVVAVTLVFGAAVLPDQRQIHRQFSHFWFNYPGDTVSASDYRSAAAYVAHNYQAGDQATYPGRADFAEGITYFLPDRMRMHDILVAQTAAQVDDEFPVLCQNLTACAAAGPQRLWLFVPGKLINNPYASPPAAVSSALKASYHIQATHYVKGITIALLTRGH